MSGVGGVRSVRAKDAKGWATRLRWVASGGGAPGGFGALFEGAELVGHGEEEHQQGELEDEQVGQGDVRGVDQALQVPEVGDGREGDLGAAASPEAQGVAEREEKHDGVVEVVLEQADAGGREQGHLPLG